MASRASVIPRASTIRGVTTADLRYVSTGFSVPAYLAHPHGFSGGPGILLGQEAFGLAEHVKDLAVNLAAEGYAVLVPDYYGRAGGPPPSDDLSALGAAIDRLDNPTILQDYKDGVGFLIGDLGCDPRRIGAFGCCTGGTYAMLLAIEAPVLACAALVYVSQLTYAELNARKPYHPIDRAGEIRCPVLFLSGAADQIVTKEKLARLEANLRAGHVPHTMRVLPGGKHTFMNPDWENYDPEATRRAWPEILAFLATHLKD